MPYRDINPAPLNPTAYGDMAASIGTNVLAGEQRGMQDALLMDRLELDRTTRSLLSDYLAAPETARPAAFNALVGADPQTAIDIQTIETAQHERAQANRRAQALDEYTKAQAVLK